MPEPIVTLNEESLKSDLRELVRKTVEDTLNGLLDEEAGDPRRRGALRARRGARGLSGRPLRQEPGNDVRRGHAAHAPSSRG